MPVYIENDYYPMDVYSEREKADPREGIRSGLQLEVYAEFRADLEAQESLRLIPVVVRRPFKATSY